MIYKADNQPIHPEINPLAAFNRLFPTGSAHAPAAVGDGRATARKRAQLDALMSQVEKLRARVGSEEMPKIDAHLGGLRTLVDAPQRADDDRRAARRPRPRRRRRWSATKTARRSAPTRPR